MPKSYDRQKEAEKRILEAARRASSLFPPGDIELSERPDLRIKTPTGEIGVEVTELVRPRGNNPFPPVQDENFHQKVVRLAENYYYSRPNAQPVCVRVFFLDDEQFKRENPEGRRLLTDKRTGRKQEKMARSLAEFVKNHVPEAGPRTFKRREMAGQMEGDETLRTGFEVIAISPLPGPWRSGESATMPPLDPAQLYARIRDKGKLLPKYRKEAPDLPIWLLICSGPSVSRGVPMPPTVGQWNFPSDFDRVLLFSSMDNRVFEIGLL